MEKYGCYISMNGKEILADTRKELEESLIEDGAESAVAKSCSYILWENMLDTQWKIAREIEER